MKREEEIFAVDFRVLSPFPTRNKRRAIVAILVTLLLSVPAASVFGQEIAVRAAVEKQSVFVGESFLFQVQVEGSDSPVEPDLSGLTDFQVQPRGGQQNNSESITIINGNMERVSRKGYIFNYSLTPKQTGNLRIPSLSVLVDGKNYQTRPIAISAEEPMESEDFKLRFTLSRDQCYVGEPIVLTITWYIGKDVEGFEFNVPLLDDPRFSVADLPDPTITQQNAIKIPLGRKTVIGKKARGHLDGRRYLTVSFQQILVPKQAGSFSLPQAMVSGKVLVEYNRSGQLDPFEDFFNRDFFGHRKRGVYKTLVTPSNEPELKVAALPTEGRPADFSGLVGEYSIVTEAVPLEVNVGDPITLTILVTGPEYMDNVELPPLQENKALNLDFKVPEEMATGEVQGRVKEFTQTIRAKHADVKEIPSITLSYFNSLSGRYERASSESIPLSVKATRIVTAMDAEGRQVEEGKREIKVFAEGIAYNYEDFSVLENHDQKSLWLYSGWGLLFGVVPPGIFMLSLTGAFLVRQRRKDPEGQVARKAFAEFSKSLKSVNKRSSKDMSKAYTALAEAIRIYLGKKMRMAPGAVTYRDVEERIADSGVSAETLAGLQKVLEQCEAYRYAGGAMSRADFQEVVDQGRKIIDRLERSLK